MSARCGRLALLLAVLLAAQPTWAGATAGAEPSPERGRALFVGAAPLVGRIALHTSNLPPEVLRCANCHDAAGSPPVLRTVAPALRRAWLIAPRERRGGPLSAYDLAAFCRLLQTGQDPANLIVNVQMPRYTVSDQDCGDLWRHLIGGDHE
jgi:hypothetical protein